MTFADAALVAEPRRVSAHAAVCVAASLIWAVTTATVAGAAQPPSIIEASVGFAGAYKVGFWTPFEVVLRGGDGNFKGVVEVTVTDGDGVRSRFHAPLEVRPRVVVRQALSVRFGRVDADVEVSLKDQHDGTATIARRVFRVAGKDSSGTIPRALGSQQRLIVALGPSFGVDESAARFARASGEPVTVVHLDRAEQLPVRWFDYEAVDTLVIAAGPRQVYEGLRANPKRLDALVEWIEMGGRLLLVVGSKSSQALAAASPLAALAPGKLAEMVTLRRTTALETFVGTTAGVPLSNRDPGFAVPRFSSISGTELVRQGDLALVVRTPRVLGDVTFVGCDLWSPPLSNWQVRDRLVSRLLWGEAAPDENPVDHGAAATLGIIDLAGQLRAALDQFAGIRLAPFWLVAVLVTVYAVLIGPADYLILNRWKRLRWTWLTFPLLVAAFCILAWWLAHRWKGNTPRANQVDLVDVDLATHKVRGTTWACMFSPATAAHDLKMRLKLPGIDRGQPEQVLLSWSGVPGSGLGALEPATAPPAAVSQGYAFSQGLDSLIRVPMPIWSTRAFIGRWRCQAELDLDTKLFADSDNVVEGSFTSRLKTPLTDCLLVCGRWAYVIGDVAPGERVDVRPGEQRDLEHVLKDFKMVRERKDVLVHVSTPYDPSSFDLASIVRQMMFYSASGGRDYAGLAHTYLAWTDLSGHLALGRAMLIGRGPPVVEVRDQGGPLGTERDQRLAYYRFILPLSPTNPTRQP